VAYAIKIAKNYSKEDSIVVNLSGRGEKDLENIFKYLEQK
jgi:tryptophan synthase beta chain